MGSLPNLHELGKYGEQIESGYRPGPALGHLCGGCNGVLSTEEKSKILHRYSGHQRITKARSNPQDSNKIVYDDFMLEHMATYSPISTRSRYNLHIQGGGALKRRDSLNSSIGATSVRRLLAVVRGGYQGSGIGRGGGSPVYTKRVLLGNLIVICMCHLLTTAAYLPFLALQSSVSVWTRPLNSASSINIDVGSLLITGLYLSAAISALLAPCLIKRVGASVIIALSYGLMLIFFTSHLYPIIYITIPASLLVGIAVGLLSCAHISFLMTLSHRITGLFHEDDEDNRQARRTCVIRRVARAFQAAHDFGLIFGSIISALIIIYTINIRNGVYENELENSTVVTDNCSLNSATNTEHCSNTSQVVLISTSSYYDYNSFLDDIFDHSEDGRLCGMQACPTYSISSNISLEAGFRVLPTRSAELLIGVYAGACAAAGLLAALGLDKIRILIYQDPMERGEGLAALRAIRDAFRDRKLLMTAPIAIFIGIEQAFMYADFSKSYVVCTLGIHRLNLVFLSMGLLQSIAACTLSMLLRTIRRYYVVAVGFLFHGCLLMVLIVWKPIEDDPALFYVISAAWGVCNSIWEMLNFTLLTGLYSDNFESAFAISSFLKFMGMSIAFAFHGILCNYWKLYAMAFLMPVAVLPFTWLEIRLENLRKVKNITRL